MLEKNELPRDASLLRSDGHHPRTSTCIQPSRYSFWSYKKVAADPKRSFLETLFELSLKYHDTPSSARDNLRL